MIKNAVDILVCSFAYALVGFQLSYATADPFVPPDDMARFFFNLAFASTAATILSGALAERLRLNAYIILTLAVGSVIYPIVTWWVWADDGLLQKQGYIDFAGGSVVHVLGGVGALTAAAMLGPRVGRYPEYSPWDMPVLRRLLGRSLDPDQYMLPPGLPAIEDAPHPFRIVSGTLFLWGARYGFNCGSTMGVTAGGAYVAARVAVITTMGAVGGGLAIVAISMMSRRWVPLRLCTGILAGLVSITAGAPHLGMYEAMAVGALGALLARLSTAILKWCQIDDVVGAFGTHGVPGAWGVLAVALFAKSASCGDYTTVGLFYAATKEQVNEAFVQVGVQLGGLLLIIAFTSASVAIVCFVLNQTPMKLRVSFGEELTGLDWMEQSIKNMHQARMEVVESLVHSVAGLNAEWDLSWLSAEAKRLKLHKSTSRTMETTLNHFVKASRALRDASAQRRSSTGSEVDVELPVFMPLGTLVVLVHRAEMKKGVSTPDDRTFFVEVKLVRGDPDSADGTAKLQPHPGFRRARDTAIVDEAATQSAYVWEEPLVFANVGNEVVNDLLIQFNVYDARSLRDMRGDCFGSSLATKALANDVSAAAAGFKKKHSIMTGSAFYPACPSSWEQDLAGDDFQKDMMEGGVKTKELCRAIRLEARRSSLARRMSFMRKDDEKKIIITGKLYFSIEFRTSDFDKSLSKAISSLVAVDKQLEARKRNSIPTSELDLPISPTAGKGSLSTFSRRTHNLIKKGIARIAKSMARSPKSGDALQPGLDMFAHRRRASVGRCSVMSNDERVSLEVDAPPLQAAPSAAHLLAAPKIISS
ncbi:unnamed protein product [Vitrella brassicaformis CCMP3155]|uniref:Ammonium transporter AmtB-like domain-containing protein n=1 Tax=Vitrella brassicaformis (strain CCMP3155) TaxID=1169540 RepID=A0A0G4FM62_VITBC|nr:unnamed protein product [Vitrella brassicaformis CCMP3155]|eukprot:CEM14635.1 unnamed protein product [Vitrella brassicaformis CCMP3155]